MTRLTSPSDVVGPIPRQAVDAVLLKMAYARLRLSVLLTVLVGVVFVGLFWRFFPSEQKIVWVGLMLGVSVLRLALWWWHARAHDASRRHAFWQWLFFIGSVAAGASWAYGAIMLMPPAGDNRSMLLVIPVLAVSAVSMSALGAQMMSMFGFQLAAMLPAAIALVATGGEVERMAGAVVLAAMVSLMLVGRVASGATRSLVAADLRLSHALEETSAARERAEASSLAKSRFLANMSHELRSPLNAVIGAAQLMRSGEPGPQRHEPLIDAIERSGTNLLGLIDNILDLSRIEAGAVKPEPQDFDLFECVDAALATAGLAARAKGLQLACIADPGLPAWRHADAARLRQVLLNLLGNATKFTQQGSVIVRVAAGTSPHEVRITIADTGVGIAADALANVFEPFRQGDDSTTRRFGGSGLGLAIVQQIVSAMGGQVSVRSAAGRGAEFEVVLPLALATPAAPQTPGFAHLRVAFVEPQEASADALQAVLGRMGCEGRRCRDALEVRDWLGAAAAKNAWLLVSTDAPQLLATLEPVLGMLRPGHVIGMSGHESVDAEALPGGFKLRSHVVKPVARASLISCFTTRPDGADTQQAPSRNGAAMPAAPAPEQTGADILVVEDDLLNRTIVSRMLQHAGFTVHAVADGHAALASLRERRFDLVLMDWQMPDMDGLEATRRIRAGAAGELARHLPVVALTANAFAEDREACLAAGMNDFLTKPVLAGKLSATIVRWLAPRQAQERDASDASDAGVA